MKKRIFSGILAVVTLVTAIFAMPKIQKTTAYDTSGTNTTWNSSYHALSEDAGTAAEPGYVGPYTHTIPAEKDAQGNDTYFAANNYNEYAHPEEFAVISYNDCNTKNDNKNNQPHFGAEGPASPVNVNLHGNYRPFQNLPTADSKGTGCYSISLKNSGQQEVSFIAAIYNRHDFDITGYSYLRFQMCPENLELLSGGSCTVQIHLKNGNIANKAYYNIPFEKGAIYDFLFDVRDLHGIAEKIQVHVSNVRRATNDATNARLLFDNFRFIKNKTHTDVFGYTPTYKEFMFHGCETTDQIQNVTYASGNGFTRPNYQKYMDTTGNHGSIINGNGAFVYGPNGDKTGVAYGKNDWYQLAFLNREGVIPSEYGYFRFYMHLGEKFRDEIENSTITIHFNTEHDYNGHKSSVVSTKSGVKLSTYRMSSRWYVVTVNVTGITQRIKSVSIQFGDVTVEDPGEVQDEAKIHFDYLHFYGYNYAPNVSYPYHAGHYKLLHDFESNNQSIVASRNLVHTVNHSAIAYENKYQYNFDGWASLADGSREKHPITNVDMFSAGYPHTVTQGRYAVMWRTEIRNHDTCSVSFDFNQNQDLSKFTHFSLDMTVRDMQQAAAGEKYAGLPGLMGNNEKFKFSVTDKNGNTSNLVFFLRKNSSTTDFVYSPDHGVEGFPLWGFVPGYSSNGVSYSPVGPMRLVFNMGEVMEHAAQAGFDITNIKNITLHYVRSESGRSQSDYEFVTSDTRRLEVYLDNLVAFTPDITLNVQVTGAAPEDAGQRVVMHVNGTDSVTQHVDIEYSAYPFSNNGLEIIENIPLNSYNITMEPWAWRYHENKNKISTSLPLYNNTADHRSSGKKLGYKAICTNKQKYLYPTVTFNLTRHHPKWLDENGYAAY